MEEVIVYKGLKLIRKYEQYYIRFIGGQYEEYPCDLRITNKEALEIISDKEKIKAVRDEYKKKINWTISYFIDSSIMDYMFYECNMSQKRIEKGLEKLNRHNDIKTELYETITYGEFPKAGAVCVCEHTAQELNSSTHLSILGSYNYLIYLREDPENAISDLKRGLPIK